MSLKRLSADSGRLANPLKQQLSYGGDLYLGQDYSVKNIPMRDELRLPGVNRMVGGMPTKNGLLWIYVFHQVDYQEIVDVSKAFLVSTEKGKVVLKKTVDLQGLTGGLYDVSAAKFGKKLFLYFPHVLPGITATGLLDLDTLVYKDLGKHKITINQFGGIFNTDSSETSFLNTETGIWMQVLLPVTENDLDLVSSYAIGANSLLSYQGTFDLEPAGVIFSMPKKADYEDIDVWTDGKQYIGLTWKVLGSSKKAGVLLDAKTLNTLCPIVVRD